MKQKYVSIWNNEGLRFTLSDHHKSTQEHQDMSKLKGNILLIDDDKDVLYTANLVLKQKFENVRTETDPKRIPRLIESFNPDVIFLDMNYAHGATTGNEGLFWLKEIIKMDKQAHVIMNTAYGDIKLAVEAMKLGAIDFIVKPWEREKLVSTAVNAFNLKRSRAEVKELKQKQRLLNEEYGQPDRDLVFVSDKMQGVMSMVKKVASTDASVLILGENGTGKEVIAREIQRLSQRKGEPFIKVDLGALPPTLFESELFGHVKGAFTDAQTDKAGKFELANGGTIFMDEIGNIPPHLQIKLLSVLQNGEVTRIGATASTAFDVRLISATNSPLGQLVSSGDFREDLLYRINTIELTIPPLRERKEDIVPIAQHYLEYYSTKYKKKIKALSKKAEENIQNYSWPGNIRELQHAIERAIILSETDLVEIEDLGLSDHISQPIAPETPELASWEQTAIQKAIRENDGNLSKAAEALGMGRTTLYRKIKKYGL